MRNTNKRKLCIGTLSLLFLKMVVLTLILSGCQIPFFFHVTTTNPLKSVDWARVIAVQQPGCTANPNDIADGRFGLKDFFDVTGDGKIDTFVLIGCNHSAPIIDDQYLEVFDGASDPARPHRIGTLLKCEVTQKNTSAGSSWQGCDFPRDLLFISGNTITVIYAVQVDNEDNTTGTSTTVYFAKITDVFFWNGSGFIRRSHSEIPQPIKTR